MKSGSLSVSYLLVLLEPVTMEHLPCSPFSPSSASTHLTTHQGWVEHRPVLLFPLQGNLLSLTEINVCWERGRSSAHQTHLTNPPRFWLFWVLLMNASPHFPYITHRASTSNVVFLVKTTAVARGAGGAGGMGLWELMAASSVRQPAHPLPKPFSLSLGCPAATSV